MNVYSVILLLTLIVFYTLLVGVWRDIRTKVRQCFSIYVVMAMMWSFTTLMLSLNILGLTRLWGGLVPLSGMMVLVAYYHFVRVSCNGPLMVEQTVQLMHAAIREKTQINIIVNNRAGGNAPLSPAKSRNDFSNHWTVTEVRSRNKVFPASRSDLLGPSLLKLTAHAHGQGQRVFESRDPGFSPIGIGRSTYTHSCQCGYKENCAKKLKWALRVV